MIFGEYTTQQLKDWKALKVEEITRLVASLKAAREDLYQIERRLHDLTDPHSPFIEDDLF